MRGIGRGFLVLAAACATGIGLAEETEVSLAGRWRLVCTTNAELACGIDVPGDVHTALFAAGLLADPFRGRNEQVVQWVGKTGWRFSRTFELDAAFLSRKRIDLVLDDVDTFAEILVNGRSLGRTRNRFCRWTFDAKAALRPGRNEIAVVFADAWAESARRRREAGRGFPMGNVLNPNQSFIRKPACHAGWDWGPCQMVVGLCGAVRLVAYDDFRLDYVYSEQRFSDDMSRCDLAVFADITDADGRSSTVTNRQTIANPPLWWPAGMGAQRFHEAEIDVRGRRVRHRVGLRKIEARADPGLSFRVNGRPFFAKGANWIPCDAFDARQTNARYRDLLTSAATANMNMIRVWGGGQYEKDVFYDLCDELGLLVWQDHMFACGMYPATPPFIDEVRAELRHQTRRLRDHASVALWCGDNECIGAIAWYDESIADPAFYTDALRKRHAAQGECAAANDPTRLFWPSSPCGGIGADLRLWNDPLHGDKHDWRVWGNAEPLVAYYEPVPRFCSEFGFQSFPSMEVAETFATREQILARGPDFEWHQKHPAGNRLMRKMLAENFPPPKDVPSELRLSQHLQALAMKTAIEEWRSKRPTCAGVMYWQLNDNWPVAGWSSIEYGGKWKSVHYVMRRLYEPVAVVASPGRAGGKVDFSKGTVVVLNDTAETVRGEAVAEYWSYGGALVKTARMPVAVAPDSVAVVGAFEKIEGTFLALAFGGHRTDWHFGAMKDMPLVRAKTDARIGRTGDGRMTVTLSADRPAFYVWANVRGVRGEFDDNCLTLLPGRPVTLTFSPKEAADADELARNLTVTSLTDLASAGSVERGAGER